MKRLKRPLCLCISLILCFFSSACSKKADDPEDQIINYIIENEPVTLDPQIADDSGSRLVIMNIFEGLVRTDSDNNITPGAAERWDISKDKMMYTFHLRKGLKWSDGSGLDSEDFVYGLKRAIQPQTKSTTASTLFCIKNAEKINSGKEKVDNIGVFSPDKDTVVIQLEYPDSNLLYLLATPPAMPCNKVFFEKAAGQYGRTDDKILGNGAFYVREDGWEHNQYIYLRKNTKYTGKDKPVPYGVNITINGNTDNMCSLIESGETDCGAISSYDTQKAQKLNFHLKGFGDTVWGISFNSENEVLKNNNIRNALLSSLNRESVLKNLPSECNEAKYIIPDSAELEEKEYRDYAKDEYYKPYEKPAELLKKGLSELKLSAVPNLTILCSNDEVSQGLVSNVIQGFNGFTKSYFNKKPVSLSELKDHIGNGSFEIVIAPLTIQSNSPLSTLELFESTSRYNVSSLKSDYYDDIVKAIRKNHTLSSVDKIKEAEDYLLSDGLFYPLYTENRYYASAENVTGIIFHPYGAQADFFYAKKTPKD